MTTSQDLTPASLPHRPVVVAIGASAGGLTALKTFFDHVPKDSGLTFVVVVHLSPEHESHLADLLQPHVSFPVQQVIETTPLKPNHVYVIPPNANLSAIDTHLRLSKLEENRRERAPIDHFFRTLANTHDGHSIGVVLTGTGSDGTLGIKEIKAKGGLVFVQDPNEAEYDGMPQSAIITGLVDRILPVASIPEAIVRAARTKPQIPLASSADTEVETDRQLLQKVFAQLRARTDRDFSRYKRSTILRRIARRMQLNYIEDLPTYLDKLRKQPEEALALAEDFLITVTNFFRDAEVFEKLEKKIIPHLFEGKGPSDTLRVWSVGCATGEEAYSLAILLAEEASRREAPPQIQIFASDLHKRSLEKAREGFYSGDIASDVSPARLSRFFQKENGGYRVHKEIRELVVFTPHNLLGDPPFSQLDLITCRNLLIYLQREIQNDVIGLFHYALRLDGYLLLGSTETVEDTDLFRMDDKRLCFYQKRNVLTRELHLPVFPLTRTRLLGGDPSRRSLSAEPEVHATIHLKMLERFALPSLLVGADNRLVHLSKNAGRYLVLAGGEPSMNVFKVVREELRVELMAAVQSIREKKEAYDSNPICVHFDGHAQPVVMRVRSSGEEDGYLLVIFEERSAETSAESSSPDTSTENPESRLVKTFQRDLTASHERLQGLIEEYEVSQEEMKASNEEMQSANEELRSTMEELETSKEELQSINEELQTVNQENRHKVEELAQLSSDLQNLLTATEIATLFLDRELRILRFTPRLGELFNIRVTDRGRPVSDLTHRLGYKELASDAQSAFQQLIPVEREVRDDVGRWYLTRVLPYRGADDRIEGAVITFVDITRRIQAESNLRANEERYRLLVENAKEYAIFMLDPGGHITTWNSGAERLFGYQEEEVLGRKIALLFTEEDRSAGVPETVLKEASDKMHTSNEGWRARKDGSRFWARGSMAAFYSDSGTLGGFVKVLRDNSDRKRAEEQFLAHEREMHAINQELSLANSDLLQFAYAASHDLREPVRTMSVYGQLLMKAAQEGHQETVLQAADTVVRASLRINQLLNDLLTYTEVSNNPLENTVQHIDLNAALTMTLDNLRLLIDQSGANVSYPTLPTVTIQGREGMLVQVFQNLIENAIKYRRGVPQVSISAERKGADWQLAVSDNGSGIPPQFYEHIFGVFKRLHGKDIAGTGMGLAICKRAIERCGGRIWVESKIGQGSTFYFSLPAL